jgi:hypothetical protein
MADGMGARDWVMDGNPPRTEAQAAAERNALRRKPVTARQMDVLWHAPGTNWKLRVDVDFDEHRVPHINEVTDISGQPIPLEAIWFDHKPLLDVLIEWLCETPADEMERV